MRSGHRTVFLRTSPTQQSRRGGPRRALFSGGVVLVQDGERLQRREEHAERERMAQVIQVRPAQRTRDGCGCIRRTRQTDHGRDEVGEREEPLREPHTRRRQPPCAQRLRHPPRDDQKLPRKRYHGALVSELPALAVVKLAERSDIEACEDMGGFDQIRAQEWIAVLADLAVKVGLAGINLCEKAPDTCVWGFFLQSIRPRSLCKFRFPAAPNPRPPLVRSVRVVAPT